MSVIVVLGQVLLAAGGGAFAIYATTAARRMRKAVLLRAADRRGGSVETIRGLIVRHRLTTVVDGLAVEVEIMPDIHSVSTTWRVSVPPPGTTSLTIAYEGLGSFLGHIVGAQDLEIGIADFDNAFVVKSLDLPVAKRLWTRSRCETMVAGFKNCKLSMENDRIVLERQRTSRPEDFDIDAGIDFLVELARADAFGMGALQSLPDVVFRSTGGDPYVEVKGPGEISIGLYRTTERVYTRAVGRTAALPGIESLEIIDGRCDDLLTGLAAPARALIGDLGTARVTVSDPGIAITWSMIETDHKRLTAAIEVLRALSGVPAHGVYR